MRRTNGNTRRLLLTAASLLIFAPFFAASATAQTTGGVKGRVKNLQGDGIGGATISARQNGRDVKTVKSGSKGDFVLDGLEEGIYNLAFEAKGYSTAVRYDVPIKKGKPRDLGDRLILLVDRGTRVIIKGSVFFKEGTSAPGATVVLERVSSDGSVRKLSETTSDYMGEFGFNQPEGAAKFRLTATFKDGKGTADLNVDSAMVYRLAIKLDIARQE